ncbi:MAG: PEP-CTERM sorting domain-containing protein [Pirellula sp.]
MATFSGEFSSSAVPEPTSMAIFGLGALGMAAYRARRKTKT